MEKSDRNALYAFLIIVLIALGVALAGSQAGATSSAEIAIVLGTGKLVRTLLQDGAVRLASATGVERVPALASAILNMAEATRLKTSC